MIDTNQQAPQQLYGRKVAFKPFVPVQGSRSRKRQYLPRGKRAVYVLSAADFSSALASADSQTLTAIAGVVGAAGVAALTYVLNKSQQGSSQGSAQSPHRMSSPGKIRRKNAVVVFGASGKMGQKLVRQLLGEGRQVVAAVRSGEKSASLFAELLTEYKGRLDIQEGVDVTNESSINTSSLWQGVSQVALCVGPVFGRQENGEMGYKDGMTSERVDAQGIQNVIAALQKNLQRPEQSELQKVVVPLRSDRDLVNWERIDDVIMGGQSSSSLQPSGNGQTAVWSGDLIIEGGGFCGTRNKKLRLDLSEYDGIQIRVKGDGQIYKINLKTADKPDDPESTYAATFSTSKGDWQTIRIPFSEFVAVTRARTNPDAPPLDPKRVGQIGFRLSRFDFNNLPNPAYKPGPFRLEFESGIWAYKGERPAVVMVSSSAVERNAIIGDDLEARKKDIPIVQLNPGGILNYKYKGEMAIRSSGLPYCILRPVGLTTEREDESFVMEAAQGDTISGKISRGEVATVISAALKAPASKGKTLEVRRCEAEASRGKTSSPRQLEQLFLTAVEDWQRPKRNLPPLPMVTDPPPPPTKERVNEILADPRVREVAERSKREGASSNGSSAQNGSSAGNAAQASASQNGAASNGASNGAGNGKQDAQEWIQDWKQRTKA